MKKFLYVGTLMQEFWGFAKTHKIYWILPLVFMISLFVLFIVIGQVSTPFIYTLF